MPTLLHYYHTLIQVIRLPVATLNFIEGSDSGNIRSTYLYYTKRHPRYKLIRHKTLGAALIDLDHVNSREKYTNLIKGKNGAAYHAKRARARGYTFSEIDRNKYIDNIHHINISCTSRQGRPMDAPYQNKIQHFESLPNFRYYGISNDQGDVVAYANLGFFGNFCGFSQLIGLRNNDGIMHLLMTEIVSSLIDQKHVRYIMYDTFFGALPGLRLFKTMVGFRPYRAKYILS
jgi:hypothetical protein